MSINLLLQALIKLPENLSQLTFDLNSSRCRFFVDENAEDLAQLITKNSYLKKLGCAVTKMAQDKKILIQEALKFSSIDPSGLRGLFTIKN